MNVKTSTSTSTASLSSIKNMSTTPLTQSQSKNVIIIIGASGQVGQGIFESFKTSKSSNWKIIAIDPKEPSCYLENNPFDGDDNNNNIQFFNQSWEDIPDNIILQILLDNNSKCYYDYLEICYAADEGNRDVYTKEINLSNENDNRFKIFLQRLHNILLKKDDVTSSASISNNNNTTIPTIHISYVGGSWTRRKIIDDDNNNTNNYIVSDNSDSKDNGGDNLYEKAKTSAYNNVQQLYATLNCKDWCSITFYDYISVVPNYSPNFTIHKMIQQAFLEDTITYSVGDDYGRPLLHSKQAGDIVRLCSEKLYSNIISSNNIATTTTILPPRKFNLMLIPGYFIKFEAFATICKEEMMKHLQQGDDGATTNITFQYQKSTPNFLKTKCESSYVNDELLIQPDKKLVLDGLRDTATCSIQHYSSLTTRKDETR